MAGSGVVEIVDYVSDRDGAPVWRLTLIDGPGNVSVRKALETNRSVVSGIPAHVAVMLSHKRYPVCPITAGDAIRWDGNHIWRGDARYDKHGFEFDIGAPLSPP